MFSFAAPQHQPKVRPSVTRRQWAAVRTARQAMTVPTDPVEADEQATRDLIDAALRNKTAVMRATGCHDEITAVVEHRPADPNYRLLPARGAA